MRFLLLLVFTYNAGAQTAELPTIPVTVKAISDVLIERRLTANAQVVAQNNSQLSAEITAVVKQIHADIGDVVAAGDLLVSLDVVDLNLQLDQAKANSQAAQARLTQAELRLQRAKEIKTYISSDDLLARETDVAVLRADLLRLKVAEQTAQRQLDKAQIIAPFTGVVTARQAQLGQLLVMGSPVLNLVQVTNAEIQAKIPSQLAAQLSSADRLEFVADNQNYAVELIQLSQVVDAQAALQSARFKPTDQQPAIGQTGQLVWYLNGQLLSADLVVKRAGKLGVFIAESKQNNTQAAFIELPAAQEGRPVALDEVPDWQVIIGGRERLQDGQSISIKQD